jgi:hypothetical protein
MTKTTTLIGGTIDITIANITGGGDIGSINPQEESVSRDISAAAIKQKLGMAVRTRVFRLCVRAGANRVPGGAAPLGC